MLILRFHPKKENSSWHFRETWDHFTLDLLGLRACDRDPCRHVDAFHPFSYVFHETGMCGLCEGPWRFRISFPNFSIMYVDLWVLAYLPSSTIMLVIAAFQ